MRASSSRQRLSNTSITNFWGLSVMDAVIGYPVRSQFSHRACASAQQNGARGRFTAVGRWTSLMLYGVGWLVASRYDDEQPFAGRHRRLQETFSAMSNGASKNVSSAARGVHAAFSAFGRWSQLEFLFSAARTRRLRKSLPAVHASWIAKE